MKQRISVLLFVLPLLATTVLSGCAVAYGEDHMAAYAFVPDEDLTVISEGIDTFLLSGIEAKSLGNHGANQTRVVSVSSGTYMVVLTESSIKYETSGEQRYTTVLIRLNPDGSAEKIYEDYLTTAAMAFSLMADANEDIWLYAGWGSNSYLNFKLVHYDVSENRITNYETQQRQNQGDDGSGYAYSTSMMDAEHGKIYGIINAGSVPGWMAWCEFDIEKREWQSYKTVALPNKSCYQYSYPDGNGGFITVAIRDIMDQDGMTDAEGYDAEEAAKELRSRDKDAGDLWDQLYIFHIPDPSVAELERIPVEEADYDVRNGLYPTVGTGYMDTLVDSNGNLHVLYSMEDDGIPGNYKFHKIYDISDGFKLLCENELVFLYGSNCLYETRLYEDLSGNVYILASPAKVRSQIEVWKATDDLNSQFALVHNEKLEGMGDTNGTTCFILANSRGNSNPSDIASFIVSKNDTWYAFTIDLALFADR